MALHFYMQFFRRQLYFFSAWEGRVISLQPGDGRFTACGAARAFVAGGMWFLTVALADFSWRAFCSHSIKDQNAHTHGYAHTLRQISEQYILAFCLHKSYYFFLYRKSQKNFSGFFLSPVGKVLTNAALCFHFSYLFLELIICLNC